MDPIPDEVMPSFRQTPKASPCKSNKVYVVRLTAPEWVSLVAGAEEFYRRTGFSKSSLVKLQSARPEHPERQQALELVAKAARRAKLVPSEPGTRLLLGALDRLESLEGK